LRNIIGELDLDATLTSRDIINTKMRAILDEGTDKWGIKINRVELKNIMPPAQIIEAMEKQMRAERERRESILRAEGEKRSAILNAEGEKEANILQAEGEREAMVRRAKGEAESILLVQRAKADGIKAVFSAIKEMEPTQEVISIRALEALEKIADGQATKLVVPTEVAGILGSLQLLGL
ncbi:MAG TPA: peptidase, partial [Firmicutes bacterium]|nr:peptidase [Bacillota bacterium]